MGYFANQYDEINDISKAVGGQATQSCDGVLEEDSAGNIRC